MTHSTSRNAGAIAVLGLLCSLALPCLAGCGDGDAAISPPTTTATGVVITELATGSGELLGEQLRDGDYAAVHYDARIARIGDVGAAGGGSGDVGAAGGGSGETVPYDSTRDAEPFVFKLGTTHLLPGFADGVRGLREGGRRRLLIPPDQAHGSSGRGRVPPYAWLEYEVDLIALFRKGKDGLQYWILEAGDGEPPTDGNYVAIEQKTFVLETGRLLSDTDKSGSTLGFKLGDLAVIPGLDAALRLMKPRARWQIALPPPLAFGPLGIGVHLLPGQDLLMEVELLRVERR